jgi:hypothetical protein
LFRYYWLIIKLVLTIIAVTVLMLQTSTINMLSDAALHGDLSAMNAPRMAMILHAAGGLVVLIVATVLSIYKPRGMTAYGARKIAASA